ncbi:MAG: DNA polymerase I [Proteobacteria bacterium]|nr:DNA polymerase I [Pseudomonadota bacterium]
MNKLYLIDGSAFLYRAYYALPYLSNSRGFPTRVVFGFLKMLTKIIKEHKPTHIAVVFDSKKKTFRNEIFENYKIKRPPLPEEIRIQIPNIHRLLESLNINILMEDGLEADDLIAGLTKKFSSDAEICIVTADKDLFQLVNDNIKVWHPLKDLMIDREKVIEILGIPPERITDYLALCGDSIDGIPGVKGIGEKTAKNLLNRFNSLEEIYERIDEIEGKTKELLLEQKEIAFLSKKLSSLYIKEIENINLSDFQIREPNEIELRELLKELNFFDFIREFNLDRSIDSSLPKLIELEELNFRVSKTSFILLDTSRGESKLFFTEEGKKVYLLKKGNIKKFFQSLDENSKVYTFESKELYKIIDFEILKRLNIVDLSLYSYLLYPNANHNHTFEDVLKDEFGYVPAPENNQPSLFEDADILKRSYLVKFLPKISQKLEKEISKDKDLLELYEKIEFPLVRVLADMERYGIKIDLNKFKEIDKEISEKIEILKEQIYSLLGKRINLNSPKQLSEVLYGELGIKSGKKGGKALSTSSDVLMEIYDAHPVIPMIIEYRNMSKIKNTYIDVLPDFMGKDGRIHTTFNQTLTATGRLSSSNPNLQNIPIKYDWGEKIRSAFISDEDFLLLSADYSQIEIRVLAHMSGDENLIRDFCEGKDIHTRTAVKIFGVEEDKVTKEMRRQAKTINFGILYGMGSYSLSKELKVSQKDAETFIKKYFENYERVKEFRENLIEFAKKNKYVKTLFGRKRYLYEIDSPDHLVRNNAERIALNTPIQGTSADIVKLAMISVYNSLQEAKVNFKMLLQVHDEILLEVSEKDIDIAEKIVKEKMEKVVDFKVPLEVKIGRGRNWFEAAK